MNGILFFLIGSILSLGGPWFLPKRYNTLKYILFSIAVVLCLITFIKATTTTIVN